MTLTLTSKEICEIVVSHLVNKGYTNVEANLQLKYVGHPAIPKVVMECAVHTLE